MFSRGLFCDEMHNTATRSGMAKIQGKKKLFLYCSQRTWSLQFSHAVRLDRRVCTHTIRVSNTRAIKISSTDPIYRESATDRAQYNMCIRAREDNRTIVFYLIKQIVIFLLREKCFMLVFFATI